MPGPTPPARSGESGFALLFVFAMAAAAAFLFYRELPRVAFERQREKEQLLIERGEQYRRGIQLYVRRFNRYPAALSDLEKTNNIRFLRRRYKDPMTGKPEWRLVHVGPGGVFLDSVINKPAGPDQEKLDSKEVTETVAGGGDAGQLTQPGLRRRPSEMPGFFPPPGTAVGTQPGMVGGESQPGIEQGTPASPTVQPGLVIAPGQFGQPPPLPIPGVPGQVSPQPFVQTGQAPGTQPGQVQVAPYPTQNVPGLPGPYGQPGAPSFGGITIAPAAPQTNPPYSTQPGVGGAPGPGQPPFPQPGYQPVPTEPAQNPALQMIRQILTTPRPGGLAGIQQQASPAGGQVMGGGIAGVASTLEAEAIMVYNERTKYNEWEFLYDVRKDPLKMGQLGLAAAQGATQAGSGTPAAQESGSQRAPSLYTPPARSRKR